MTKYSALTFFLEDYPRTLFPLTSTRVVLEHCEGAITTYINQHVLNALEPDHSFLPQTRVFSSKTGLHLRRTVKLDPIAEYFLYDIVLRNRGSFRKDHSKQRRSFGYRFAKGVPVSASSTYGEFRQAIVAARKKYRYSIKFDIAAYFNSIYHHDLVKWSSSRGWVESDVNAVGQFLRETNAGRSVDCLPQGLYPAKMIGADFLKFVDDSARLQSTLVLRFMDDFYLFGNDDYALNDDFLAIQRMLGERGLSLNMGKTAFGATNELDIKKQIDEIKLGLLRLRRRVIEVSDEEIEEMDVEYDNLSEEQIEYLLDLLKDPDIEEADVELVLVLLREHGEDVLSHMYSFLERFPSLSRKVYTFSREVADKPELASLLLRFAKKGKNVTEDQLFWIGKIAEEQLALTSSYPDLLMELYKHPQATTITKAKILEIAESRFSMHDLREEHLKAGKSDWLAWSAAVGSRKQKAIERNHVLSYFSKASPMNRIIADCVSGMPGG